MPTLKESYEELVRMIFPFGATEKDHYVMALFFNSGLQATVMALDAGRTRTDVLEEARALALAYAPADLVAAMRRTH